MGSQICTASPLAVGAFGDALLPAAGSGQHVERMETRDLGTKELLRRLQLCEGKLHDIGSTKLSPFKQQEILTRLDTLEHAVEPSKKPAVADTGNISQISSRLETLESHLCGVYNLNGKLIALEQIAGHIGVDIPDLDYNPGLDTEAFFRQQHSRGAKLGQTAMEATKLDYGQPTGVAASGLHASSDNATTSSGDLVLPQISRQTSAARGPSSPGHGPLSPERSLARANTDASTVRGPMPRLSDLAATVENMAEETDVLRATVEELTDGLKAALADVRDHSGRISFLEAGKTELAHKVAANEQTIATVASRKASEVSFADMTLLQGRVEASERTAAATSRTMSEHAAQVAQLARSITELRGHEGDSAVAPGKKSGLSRDIDTMLHARVAAVETKIDSVRSELYQSLSQLGNSCAKASDVDELVRGINSKASQVDIKTLAQQQAALATSINGMAEWLATRPETADGARGTGGSITKFRCLTCDREIKSQALSNGSPTAKGTFLPRLDGLAGSPPHTGRSVSPVRGSEAESAASTVRMVASGRAKASAHVTPVFIA
eukprot:303980-Chlamydomonas_euryale.AAC.25